MELSDRDRAILDIERSWWTDQGSKQAAIAARLSISPSLYYRRLGELADLPAAEAYDPLVIRRLRRERLRRRRERFTGRYADGRPQR